MVGLMSVQLVDEFRRKLEWTGFLGHGDVVSLSLVNSIEFVVAFLATGLHR
jgi:acyl-CoA synthetase (AMP-forming)/AMP-acid ligase II